MSDSHRLRGSAPWSGTATGTASHPLSGRSPGGSRSKTHLEQLHSRRTQEQLEALLAARLAELRADPPIYPPYPRDEEVS